MSSGIGQATLPDRIRTVQNVCARLKRAWHLYDQLDYFLLYGSFETDRDLGAFYKGCGYTVHAPGEGYLLEQIKLPFGIHASPDPRVFTRWRLPR